MTLQVSSDEEAIRLMNDSEFGLTASIWTRDPEAAINIGNEIDTGTWFMNRCDCMLFFYLCDTEFVLVSYSGNLYD